MKKLLSLLGAIGLVATSSATVVSCGTDPAETDTAIAIGNVKVETTDMKATVDAIKEAIKAASIANENVKSKMTSENVLDTEEPTILFDGSDATDTIAIDGITSAKLTFAKTDAVKNDTDVEKQLSDMLK
jgi:NADPH-dependent glutamate synthase beta subunit-like oxidoreductase